MESTYDDTLPLPNAVETEYRENAGDGLTAVVWLADHGIDSAPQHAALIQYGMIWNPEIGRYDFLIYAPDHVGPKHPPELAVPIFEDGAFIDLLFISESMSFARATCRASWLGRENLLQPIIRLHAHPLDWLESGCTGVCHIAESSRKALKDLRKVTQIECNDIHAALEAWDWAFGEQGDETDDELSRFIVDDTPFAIRSYFEEQITWRLARLAGELS
jgi:hypothetical protein